MSRACRLSILLLAMSFVTRAPLYAAPLELCTFQSDATPPLGAPLCYASVDPAKEIVDPLSVRGVVLLGDGKPIVLCAVDWVGIGNGTYDDFRAAVAKAAGTTPDRVALHTLHQHDAPGADSEAEALLAARSLVGAMYHVAHTQKMIDEAATAVRDSLAQRKPVTHVGVGTAKVDRVASNRRILGTGGKVKLIRFSSCTDKETIDAPEGVIDPLVRVVSFWNDDKPVAVLSYYATHPQSYYGKGGVSADFVGAARSLREEAVPGVPHIHFNGASGNVAAGKYDDGTPPRGAELAARLAAGMAAAFSATKKLPINGSDLDWRQCEVSLPLRDTAKDQAELVALMDNSSARLQDRVRAARDLAFDYRVQAGKTIELSCLHMPGVYLVHMPGELFVEYQLAAAKMRPDATVCMAAYGDYGPGYIGTEVAYSQGGYETGYVLRTVPQVEKVLIDGMAKLLK